MSRSFLASAGERTYASTGGDSRTAPWGVRVRRRVTCSPRRGDRCTRGEHGARSSSTRAAAAVATDGTQPRFRRRRAGERRRPATTAAQARSRRSPAEPTGVRSATILRRPGRWAPARGRGRRYGRAVGQFLGWCEARGLGLRDISPLHVAAYIWTHPGSVPTVKQYLAAIRILRRLARRQPGPPGEPRRGGPRSEARRHQGRDAGALAGGGEEAPRLDRHGRLGRASGPGAALGDALQLRAGERGPGDAAGRTTSGRGAGAG